MIGIEPAFLEAMTLKLKVFFHICSFWIFSVSLVWANGESPQLQDGRLRESVLIAEAFEEKEYGRVIRDRLYCTAAVALELGLYRSYEFEDKEKQRRYEYSISRVDKVEEGYNGHGYVIVSSEFTFDEHAEYGTQFFSRPHYFPKKGCHKKRKEM